MTGIVKVVAKVKVDRSGSVLEVPVLLTDQGVFEPVLDYVISQYHLRSLPWMHRVVFSCQLLLDYMEANRGLFSDPAILFSHFVQRLSGGTIGEDGTDPSQLYWLPRSINNSNQILSALNGLTDWLVQNQNLSSFNPFEEASSHQERLNYAAWHKRSQHNFLGHLKVSGLSEMMKKTRKVRGKKDLIKVDDDAIAFSEPLFRPFFEKGVGGAKDRRVAVRDQLILLLLHGCGVRESDALHLWVEDVLEDPGNPDSVIIRLYHPEDGKAPAHWKGRSRLRTRSAYLAEEYGLKPRNRLPGTPRVGWKTKVVDHADNYIQLHWFPAYLGEAFSYLWREYLLYLLPLDRRHPYAFVSFSKGHLGCPLTINAFIQNYKASLARIGLRSSKAEGLSPHAHRHAYGRRLTQAGVDPLIIKKALHHSSLLSQTVYTQPGVRDVTEAFTTATERLEAGQGQSPKEACILSWKELMKSGFSDIDPDGLYSGMNPRFKKSSQ